MRKRVFGAFAAAVALCASFAGPVLADDLRLDELNNNGQTQVDATIVDGAGEVAYTVKVPSKIDFGRLTCPSADTESYTGLYFDVSCELMQGVRRVKLSVYNEGSSVGATNQNFFLTNVTNTACNFKPQYELYADRTRIDTTQVMPVVGFDYVTFSSEGQTVQGGVRLDQRQLYPYKDDIASIAGSYTGTLVFTTSAI